MRKSTKLAINPQFARVLTGVHEGGSLDGLKVIRNRVTDANKRSSWNYLVVQDEESNRYYAAHYMEVWEETVPVGVDVGIHFNIGEVHSGEVIFTPVRPIDITRTEFEPIND